MSIQPNVPTFEQLALMQDFRDDYEKLLTKLNGQENSRGRSLAITKLEESSMWINKAITKND